MNISIENLGPQHNIISFTIHNSDYRDRFEKSLKELAKKSNFPGFRPGHVPMGMVKKMYGNTAILEELYKIINEQMNVWLKENKHELLGDALPVENKLDIDHTSENSYVFAYEIGLQPNVSLEENINKDKKFTRYKISAKEEEIDAEMDRIVKKYGKRVDVDVVSENDIVYAHLDELNEDTTVKEDGLHVDTYFNLQMINDDQQNIFLDAKPGDVKNIMDVFSVFKGDKVKIAKNILHITDATEESVEAIQPAYAFTLGRIASLVPAEMNEEFFQEISKEFGEITSETELRMKIKEGIEKYNYRVTEVTLENELFKFLGDTTNVPLPEVFLRKWFRQSAEKEIVEENFEAEFSEFLSKLKQSLIYRNVQKSHDLSVKNEEIIQEALTTLRMSYGQMGDDFIQYITQSQLKDKNFVENMHDRVAQSKFFEALKTYITIEEQEISAEEFQKLNKQEEVYAE